ncbi:MAG: hypothetical protein PSV35_05445, partial [bacterium]|nr:hypothetical protein [bacterium]
QAIIRVSKNNSVEHLHFNMTGLMNGGHNANQAITNHPNPLLYKNMPQEPKNNAILLAQNSVGNLTITDNQLNNSGVDFLITDASKDSVFTINDNQLTLLNQARTVTDSFDINAINIQTTNNTHLRVAHLDRNQINLSILSAAKSNDPRSQYGASAVNIALRGQPLDAPSMTIESMQHNIINVSSKVKVDTFFASLGYTAVFLSSGQSQFIEGPNVYTFALNKGSIHASHILNNQITMSHDENYSGAEGFNIQANHLNVEDVAHNQVIIATKGEQGIGMDFEGQDRIDVNHVTDNFLQINTLVPATLNYGFAGILIHPQLRTSQANVSNINHNYVEIPNASGTFGPSAGIELDMPTGFGFLNVTNVLNNHIVIKPFSNGSDSGRGLSPVGIYIGSPSCDHSDNTNTLTVQHINGNFVETKAVSVQTQPNALNYFNAILIQTTPSEPNEHLNNVLLKVSDISNNIIYTEIKGVAEKVRGIRINGDKTTTVEHIVNNTITLNAPQATTVAGISFFNGLTGFTNIPPQGLFETKNTSLNTIKLLGGGAVFGIATENLNVGLQTHYGLSNNNVSVVGPASTTYGFYFSAPSSFRTSPGHNLSGSITVTGIENNSFSLSPEGIGIYALAQLPLNKITFLPSLNHPELGLSVANGHTSYVRDGEGTITPTT